ncbi:EAL domain-containing protein [Acinetobacter sp. MD2]|uniref:EAL domain-containing protein n=1 Tax=Acinetobacter sp. MD2 TaxID=2600066 RepID=UPI002D1E94F5|nr:EAL domain-containing protein [Acinetobacter sp. MD2]MEB3767525.1 EAL domain-containing protein [Acinetobacter sp. MD2]
MSQKKQDYYPFLLALVGGLLGLGVLISAMQLIYYQDSKHAIEAYAQEAMDFTLQVNSEIIDSLQAAASLNIQDCSTENFNQLKKIIWNHQFINDIGIVKHHLLLCSAMWGRFQPEIILPPIGYTNATGFSKIKNNGAIFPYHLNGNMTLKNNILVVVQPKAFDTLKRLSNRFDLKITAKRANYTYFFLRHHDATQMSDEFPFQTQDIRRCHPVRDVCIEIRDYQAGVARLSNQEWWLVIMIGSVFGIVVTVFGLHFLRSSDSLSNRLKRAIKKRDLYVEYQPIVRLMDQKIVGVEALVRWNDPKYGQISPLLFINLAEKLKLDREITQFVLNQALSDFKNVFKQNADFTVSINLNKSDLITTSFYTLLVKQLKKFDVEPKQIVCEVTERVDLNLEDLSEKINQIKALGCRVSLDDFGTGTSNLSSLSGLAFDTIKIDKILLKHVTQNQFWKDLVIAIIALTQEQKYKIVFEGVETQAQWEFLKEQIDGAFAQGWLFYKSMSASDIYELLQKQINT